ncbi:MAG: bifunctional glutamate N-acetyltransferase/amino-acid acetyltransferase ArgJ [Fluviicoccus sp.]|uniref:bifunctional glutamate N-acetyltransferase/amino-acid acetyltransferase ArgJ n=1 Tax=Fluviicoccus sp. TaxID=2003552 RepID=UPI00271E691D|nr:bifunctional glutamate N-acetyltransferase/amino-acid acetyltransferase ArgJ [Fluviicoccus sp.]MDO8330016.1 bifunctional glutamate N-acetyltransferase/amino-acid acetyltransferase ArgJ [Fluviicoccus sp.]
MAVGDLTMPVMHPVNGVRIGITEAYIRYKNRRDLVVFEIAEGAETAAVFTTNAFCAAPVQVARQNLAAARTRYLVINTGNANAGTGPIGMSSALRSCAALGELANVAAEAVLPFSTGVIGEQLPIAKLEAGLPGALAALQADNWPAAATGIMTTDTLPKGASEQFTVDGVTYTLTGISKGAGMIRPNMATMLGFVATDVAVERGLLQQLLREVTEMSFNRVTIDGDTSTNDACVLVATGAAGNAPLAVRSGALYEAFHAALTRVLLRLAQLIVRDGEGATKFMTVRVEGGGNTQECCDVAYAVAHSPLIKTAFFASDPNWGRILAAIGRSGVPELDVSKINVYLDDVCICENGGAAASYREELGAAVMKQAEITIRIVLGRGEAVDTVWTCDFSYDYVKINADYRS